MIGPERVTSLIGVRAPDPGVLSVYLDVPLDPAERRGLPARVEELLASGNHAADDGQGWEEARRTELPAIREAVSAHASQWLGHSVAIFSCSGLGLLTAIPLRGQAPERAFLGARPYVRPLLAELRRSPCYAAAVVDRRHAWLFRISGEGIEPMSQLRGETVGSRRFGGWYGLQTYRNEQRARKLAKDHFAATVGALSEAVGAGGCGLIVVGGHEEETREFLGELPPTLRERLAGDFVIDPHTMTPARVRKLADEVVARWEKEREEQIAAEIAEQRPGTLGAIGLGACVDAANQRAIDVLMVPDEEVERGFACEACGSLSVAEGPCPVCGGPTHAVPDIIEELVVKVTEDGGDVEPVRGDALGDVAARRRFPPPA